MSDERTKELLARIAELAARRSAIEQDNIERDLSAILERIDSGEYRQTDFVARSVFEIPRRTREFYSYLEDWDRQAERWAEIIANFEPISEVIDLCPGWAPKIELALVKRGFSGRVRLLDKDREASQALLRFLRMWSPAFTVEVIEADLFSPPIRAPLVVGNHLLDDVLIDRFAGDRVYQDESALRRAWSIVLEELPRIEASFAEDLAGALAEYVAPGGHLILSHYPSLAERLLGTEQIRSALSSLFLGVRRSLSRRLTEVPARSDATLSVWSRSSAAGS